MNSERRLPLVTLAVIGLAVVASAVPALSRWLVFDRMAIIDGQWWRACDRQLGAFFS